MIQSGPLTCDSKKVSIYSGFDLMTCDAYFRILIEVFTNHILAENTYFRNHIA